MSYSNCAIFLEPSSDTSAAVNPPLRPAAFMEAIHEQEECVEYQKEELQPHSSSNAEFGTGHAAQPEYTATHSMNQHQANVTDNNTNRVFSVPFDLNSFIQQFESVHEANIHEANVRDDIPKFFPTISTLSHQQSDAHNYSDRDVPPEHHSRDQNPFQTYSLTIVFRLQPQPSILHCVCQPHGAQHPYSRQDSASQEMSSARSQPLTSGHGSNRHFSNRHLSTAEASPPAKRQQNRRNGKIVACFNCRDQKIACGAPLPGDTDNRCNQCQNRSLQCEFPAESLRGIKKRKVLNESSL